MDLHYLSLLLGVFHCQIHLEVVFHCQSLLLVDVRYLSRLLGVFHCLTPQLGAGHCQSLPQELDHCQMMLKQQP